MRSDRTKPSDNPIDEFFAMAFDRDGSLHAEKMRYAITHAFRSGYFAGADAYRPRPIEVPCPVAPPEAVTTELDGQAIEAKVLGDQKKMGWTPP